MKRPLMMSLSLTTAFAMAFVAGSASAHCDSLDGPVVRDARLALDRGDPMPVLKWVDPKSEAELGEAFRETLAVRADGGQARELADRYFFETLVRLHRAGEGEGFTGLKPAGSVDPGLAAADHALETGSAIPLSQELTTRISDGVAARFRRAVELRQTSDRSVDAWRAYVAAYVDYVHFVEDLDRLTRRGESLSHDDASACPIAAH